MANIGFSDVFLRSLAPPERGQKAYWDHKLPSFGVRISQGGSKTFILKRHNNLITIGRFPLLSLAEARTEAKRLLAEFTLGKVRPQSVSFPEALKLFLEEKRARCKPRTVADYDYLLNRLPFTGQLAQITGQDFARALNRYKGKSSRDHAVVAAKIFFGWCLKRRYITENPTAGYSKAKSTPRARVLSDAELQLIWKACDQNTVSPRKANLPSAPSSDGLGGRCALPTSFATIVKLLILTGQRRGEIAALRAEYCDLGVASSGGQVQLSNETTGRPQCTITLPPTLTKNRREHAFPIGTLSTFLLSTSLSSKSSVPTALLFPARGHSSNSFNGWSKSKALLDKLSGVTDWTLHDIRRTVATRMAELGVAPHVIERLLNHVTGTISGVAAVYNRARYVDEMRDAVGRWEAYLRGNIILA